jgi:hypothetical protein
MANPKGIGLSNRKGRGRPKGAKNKISFDIRIACQKHGEMAIKELSRLARESSNEATRVAAIKELLDRGYGKAPQTIGDENGKAMTPLAGALVWLTPKD